MAEHHVFASTDSLLFSALALNGDAIPSPTSRALGGTSPTNTTSRNQSTFLGRDQDSTRFSTDRSRRYYRESNVRADPTSRTPPVDPLLLHWLKARIHIPAEGAKISPIDEKVIRSFLQSPESSSLVIVLDGEGDVSCHFNSPPSIFNIRYAMYFVKVQGILTQDNAANLIHYGTLTSREFCRFDSLLRLLQCVNAPILMKKSSVWTVESARVEFEHHFDKFMASLYETAYHEKSKTVLYVGKDTLINPTLCAKNKDLVHRLESSVIHWTRQIKSVVANHDDSNTADTAGALDEIHFWHSRALDLSGITEQINRPGVQQVLAVLEAANSSYLRKFQALVNTIQGRATEAADNLKFLSILTPLCETLDSAEHAEFLKIIPRLWMHVRIIWTYSQFYNTPDQITGLLTKIGCQIINACRQRVVIEDIFEYKVAGVMSNLNNCVEYCHEWKATYHKVRQQLASSSRPWDFDESSVFVQIDAFAQRCRDLTEICYAILQFSFRDKNGAQSVDLPIFPGPKAVQVEKALFDIRDAFSDMMSHGFRTDRTDMLNVSASHWAEDFNKLKKGVKDLEVMMQNLVTISFDSLQKVSDGVDLLESFDSIAVLESIHLCLAKKTSDLYLLFIHHVNIARQEFDHHRKTPPLNLNEPTYAGAIGWAMGLLKLVTRDWNLLEAASGRRLPNVKEKEEANLSYINFKTAIDDYSNSRYEAWIVSLEALGHDFQKRLNVPLLRREVTSGGIGNQAALSAQGGQGVTIPSVGDAATGGNGTRGSSVGITSSPRAQSTNSVYPYLVCNFDPKLLNLFAEVFYLERLPHQYQVPFAVLDICNQREKLRVIREKVLSIVRDYNGILDALSRDEQKLFGDHIRRLDRRITQGVSKLSWASKYLVDKFIKDCKAYSEEVGSILTNFTAAKEVIKRNCKLIATCVLLQIERNHVYEIAAFQAKQEECIKQAEPRLMASFQEIVAAVKEIRTHFHDTSAEVQKEWKHFVSSINRMVETALKAAVKKSLQEASKAVNGDVHAEPQGLFRTHAILEKQRLVYSPAVADLSNGVVQVFEKLLKSIQIIPQITEAVSPPSPPPARTSRSFGRLTARLDTQRDEESKTATMPTSVNTAIEATTPQGSAPSPNGTITLPPPSLLAQAIVKTVASRKLGNGNPQSSEAITDTIIEEEGDDTGGEQEGPRKKKGASSPSAKEETDLQRRTPRGSPHNSPSLSRPGLIPVLEGIKKTTTRTTYYESIVADEDILKAILQVRNGINTCANELQRYLAYWEKYRAIWDVDKDGLVDRYSKAKKSPAQYDATIVSYKQQQNEIGNEDSGMTINCIAIDCTPLKQLLVSHCSTWQGKLTTLLNDEARKLLNSLHAHFDDTTVALRQPPTSLDQLSQKLQLLDELQNSAKQSTIEQSFSQVEDMYSILAKHEVAVNEEELQQISTLRPRGATFKSLLTEAEETLAKSKVEMKKDMEITMHGYTQYVAELKRDAASSLPFSPDLTSEQAFILIKDYEEKAIDCRKRQMQLQPGLSLFKLDLNDTTEIADLEKDIFLLREVWTLTADWNTRWSSWKKHPFQDLSAEAMDTSIAEVSKSLTKLGREIKSWKLWQSMKEKIEQFRQTSPLIQDLKNPALRQRHWDALCHEIGHDFDYKSSQFTLEVIFSCGMHLHADFIGELSANANKELSIETALDQINERWKETRLDIAQHNGTYYKIRSTEDLYSELEDDQVYLSTMKSSKFYQSFKDTINRWDSTLSHISEVVELLLQVQRQWMYLESIFSGSEDIRKQLPKETQLFDHVNTAFRNTMSSIAADPRAVICCQKPGMIENVTDMDTKLQTIQKSLDQYLETKRMLFPRFYFLSNDDLLEILGQSKNLTQVQKHIKKCFEGIKTLTLKADGLSSATNNTGTFGSNEGGNGSSPGMAGVPSVATAMVSGDGETVDFLENVASDCPVELWLVRVESMMQQTLQQLLAQCLHAHRTKKDSWIKDWPGQLLITVGQIVWTMECTKSLVEMAKGNNVEALKHSKKKQSAYLNRLSDMVRGSLSRIQRSKLVALITVEIHARDVIERMIRSSCMSISDFVWISQLRMIFNKDVGQFGLCQVKQLNAQLEYSYEYQGNNGRLVITPLTDRCILTLVTAMYLHRGGNPLGPAGTGKTETVKDLGKSLAKYVIVINCSDGLDYKSVGRMFCGLAQCGAWGCFDEFNRIDIEVLSVVAMQILSIMNALSANQTNFTFMGQENIKLNPNCGIFITMNPGYAGRTELPDNLKSLMRPIAMMVPDLALIAEVMLQAEGFRDARNLAKKTVTLYGLMNQQLSKQDHYDYGLRNLKAVLNCAGTLKRADPEMNEEAILMRALRDMNLPKFIKDDLRLFHLLLMDLFPSLEVVVPEVGELQRALEAEIKAQGSQCVAAQIDKMLQLRDSMATRHCNMLVGKTMSGKSTVWKTLAASITCLAKDSSTHSPPGSAGAGTQGPSPAAGAPEKHCPISTFVINPKSVTLTELYGAYELSTMEWSDGVLSTVFRQCAQSDKGDEKWLMFDGPVDTLWIESMNSVMDDNKVLTLINGDRISMSQSMSLLFEVENLSVASPATVSRAGMIYIDVEDLGWRPFARSWVERTFASQSGDIIKFKHSLFEKYVPVLLDFKKEHCFEDMPISDVNAVHSLCSLYEALLNSSSTEEGSSAAGAGANEMSDIAGIGAAGGAEDKEGKKIIGHTSLAGRNSGGNDSGDQSAYLAVAEKYFAFALVWTVLAATDEKGRQLLDTRMRDIDAQFPPAMTVYDYFVDPKKREWELWETKIPAWRPVRGMNFFQMIVPTLDTVRNGFVVNTYLSQCKRHVLLLGHTGTGKTVLAQNQLISSLPESHAKLTMNFSAATSASTTQEIIESVMEKRSKDRFGPAGGKTRLVTFIDDFNMPSRDRFGFQPPLELLRQWIDYGGWYDRQKCQWRYIMDMQLLTAMGPPSSGRPVISERTQSRFSLLYFTPPSDGQTQRIFEAIFAPKLAECEEEVKRLASPLVKATIAVYKAVSTLLLPTPEKSHYLFSLRDVSRVIQGLYQARLKLIDTKEGIARFWIHECSRVISDRFVTSANSTEKDENSDHKKFSSILQEAVDQNLGISWSQIVPDNLKQQPILFASFLPEPQAVAAPSALPAGTKTPLTAPAGNAIPGARDSITGGNTYQPSADLQVSYVDVTQQLPKVRSFLDETLEVYNGEAKLLPMSLVLFTDAILHICRISRVLRLPRGSMILVGVGGSGRQSLTRLASYVAEYRVMSIEITNQYRRLEFREDLKKVYAFAGIQNLPVVFLLSDAQVKEECFVEDIANILGSGQVPNLYTKDEIIPILEAVQNDAATAAAALDIPSSTATTSTALWDFFIQRIRTNLHIILCMSPVGDTFRNRCRMYPALITGTIVDWFHEWPGPALQEVAVKYTANMKLPAALVTTDTQAPPSNPTPVVARTETGNSSSNTASKAKIGPAAKTSSQEPPAAKNKATGGPASAPSTSLQTSSSVIVGKLAATFASIHQTVTKASQRMFSELKRRNYVTPTNYLDLVHSYQALMDEKQSELVKARDKLKNGLSKLEESRAQVMSMSIELEQKKKVVAVSQHDCEELLVVIVSERRLADEQKKQVEAESEKIGREEIECKGIAEDAQRDLNVALPALEKAMEEVDKMDKSAISEVKAYSKPPKAVETVMNAVMVLFGLKADWPTAKKKISEPNFLQQIKGYDKDNVPNTLINKIKKYVDDSEFNPESIKAVSSAASTLCGWVCAIHMYATVFREVAPKRERLKTAEESLKLKQASLQQAKSKLDEVIAKVNNLKSQYDSSVGERNRLRKEAEDLETKLSRADKLVNGLAGEYTRWQASIGKFEFSIQNLVGDSLLASAFLSYSGPFDTSYRENLMEQWLSDTKSKELPFSEHFHFVDFLAKPTDVRDWNIQGLPNDNYNTENGVIVTRGKRWPLMIDPQGQANKWIRAMEKDKNLRIIDMQMRDFLREVEKAVQFGFPVLLQDVLEELDPSLEPVLSKSVLKVGSRQVIRIGEKELDYSADFRFYITTKLGNPHYKPEVSTKTSVVNFAVKQQGLEEQLLGLVVRTEEPSLEEQKSELTIRVAADKRKLVDLENQILRLLSETEGSLLDDENLVITLQQSKVTSEEVTRQLAAAEDTEEKIDIAREGYRLSAARAAVIFFVLDDLSRIDPMYQFSLDAYMQLFHTSIQKSRGGGQPGGGAGGSGGGGGPGGSGAAGGSGSIEMDMDRGGAGGLDEELGLIDRCREINTYHTFAVYASTCVGLFARHKLLLSFQLCIRIMQQEGKIPPEEYQFLLYGGGLANEAPSTEATVPEVKAESKPTLKRAKSRYGDDRKGRGDRGGGSPLDWINPDVLAKLYTLDQTQAFSGLRSTLEQNPRLWKEWHSQAQPEEISMPSNWDDKLTDLQRLLLIRMLRPDRLTFATHAFVSNSMGAQFAEPPPFQLNRVYQQSSPRNPIIFVLSPGVDPTTQVQQLAASLGMTVEICALGQGQAPVAMKMLENGMKKGSWVFLANCHLMLSWMPTLEKMVEKLSNTSSSAQPAFHPNFRLWLSSAPHPRFPIAILQAGFKITTEPPRGLKANLLQLYSSVTKEQFLTCGQQSKYKRLLFSLSWFHAVLVERRKFKSLGWNIVYDFNLSDFSICHDLLSNFLDAYPDQTPFDALRYLIAEANYGGRVTDDWDRRLVSVYINQFFSDEAISNSRFALSSLPDYYIPEDGSLDSYREYIKSLPALEHPAAFGQHPNADISSQIEETNEMLETICSLQPQSVASNAQSQETIALRLVTTLLNKVPPLFAVGKVKVALESRSDPEPLKTVLLQELERYNVLLGTMQKTLTDVQRASKGFIITTAELEAVTASLVENKVPASWGFCYLSVKPLGSWMTDLELRCRMMSQWADVAMPTIFWLPGFTYPSGFLTALLQTAARKNGVAIDTLGWEFPFMDNIMLSSPNAPHEENEKDGLTQPKDGAYISGLYCEGARWDGEAGTLADAIPLELYSSMPVIHFKPVENKKKAAKGVYTCPLYSYPVRTGTRERPSIIIAVDIKCKDEGPDFWIKRGVALLLSLPN